MKIIFTIVFLVLSYSSFAIERPDLEINIEHNFVCKNGKSFSGKKFNAICKNLSNSPDPILYLNLDISDSILFHNQLITDTGLGNAYSWCKKELIDPATGLPQATGVDCVIHVTRKRHPTEIAQLIISYFKPDSNLLGINISSLYSQEKYYLELIEVTSGSKSKRILFKNPL